MRSLRIDNQSFMRNESTQIKPQTARILPANVAESKPSHYEPDHYYEPIEIVPREEEGIDLDAVVIYVGGKFLDGSFYLAGRLLDTTAFVCVRFLELAFGLVGKILSSAWQSWTHPPADPDPYGRHDDEDNEGPDIHIHLHVY